MRWPGLVGPAGRAPLEPNLTGELRSGNLYSDDTPGQVLVETRGKRTGKRRRSVVGMHIAGDTGWVIAEHGRHAGWVRNVEVQPEVSVRTGRRWRPARAELVADDDAPARLDAFGRSHAAAVRRFGTDLTTVRFDFTADP